MKNDLFQVDNLFLSKSFNSINSYFRSNRLSNLLSKTCTNSRCWSGLRRTCSYILLFQKLVRCWGKRFKQLLIVDHEFSSDVSDSFPVESKTKFTRLHFTEVSKSKQCVVLARRSKVQVVETYCVAEMQDNRYNGPNVVPDLSLDPMHYMSIVHRVALF